MATTNPFLNIRSKIGDEEKSMSWYKAQIKSLSSITPNRLLSNAPDLTSRILPGNMYMFFYDAKHQDKLPYWDMFPLVLPFRSVQDGFFGLNLHYLPYGARFKLLGYLHDLSIKKEMSEDNRLRLNWRLLNSASRFAPAKACVKHYLYEQLKSRFLQVQYPDWITAAMLPVERFVGANKTAVWEDSRKKY
jgi:hypothetical protein